MRHWARPEVAVAAHDVVAYQVDAGPRRAARAVQQLVSGVRGGLLRRCSGFLLRSLLRMSAQKSVQNICSEVCSEFLLRISGQKSAQNICSEYLLIISAHNFCSEFLLRGLLRIRAVCKSLHTLCEESVPFASRCRQFGLWSLDFGVWNLS